MKNKQQLNFMVTLSALVALLGAVMVFFFYFYSVKPDSINKGSYIILIIYFAALIGYTLAKLFRNRH